MTKPLPMDEQQKCYQTPQMKREQAFANKLLENPRLIRLLSDLKTPEEDGVLDQWANFMSLVGRGVTPVLAHHRALRIKHALY